MEMDKIVKKRQNAFAFKRDKLRAIRNENALSQRSLDKELGLKNSNGRNTAYWESGRFSPTSEMEAKLCAFFEVEPDYFRKP